MYAVRDSAALRVGLQVLPATLVLKLAQNLSISDLPTTRSGRRMRQRFLGHQYWITSRTTCFGSAALTRVNSERLTLAVSETRARCAINIRQLRIAALRLELNIAHRMDFPRGRGLHPFRADPSGGVINIEEQRA